MSNQNEENKDSQLASQEALQLNRQIDDSQEIDLGEDLDGPSETEKLLLALGLNPKADAVQRIERPAASDADLAKFAAQRASARDRANQDGRKVVAKTIKRGIRKVSSFGSTAESEHVERDVVQQKGDAASEATRKRLDDQLDDPNFLIEATGGDKKQIEAVEKNKDDLKKLRDELSGLFTIGGPPTTHSAADSYIEGVDGDSGAKIVHDPGLDGVRIKFKSKTASGTDEQIGLTKTADSVLENDGSMDQEVEIAPISDEAKKAADEAGRAEVERLLAELRKHRLTPEQLKSLDDGTA